MQKLSENITIILGASSILLLITLFIVMMVMAYLRRDIKHLKEKEMMEADFEKQLLQAQLETQEETLHQLSTEIHDNVGQLLNSTKLLIGITQRSLTEIPEALPMADDTLGKAIQELRTLSKAMNKEWLQQFNFIQNLEVEIDRIKVAKNLEIRLKHSEDLSLKPDNQIILFRIVQEILQNVFKHAQASLIEIEIFEDNDSIQIQISDNGKGFNKTGITKSVGMLNISHRTKLLGGSVHWNSEQNKGTTVFLQLPVNKINA